MGLLHLLSIKKTFYTPYKNFHAMGFAAPAPIGNCLSVLTTKLYFSIIIPHNKQKKLFKTDLVQQGEWMKF